MANAGRWFLHERIDNDFATDWFRATSGGPTGDVAVVRKMGDIKFEQWFRDEIALRKTLVAATGLAHVLDDAETDGVPWLAQEWLQGLTLQQVLMRCHQKQVPIPMELSVYVVAEVARYLDGFHNSVNERGPLAIVHRDVSPSSIHLGFDGLVRFPSLLCADSRLAKKRIPAGTLIGKYSYMSPEQAHGDRALDHRSDQFSAGLVLYELVTGVRPYRGTVDVQIHAAAQAANIGSARKLNKFVPEELDEAIMQALKRDRDDRFDSCGQLAEELEEIASIFEKQATASALSLFVQRLDGALAS